MVVSKRKHTGTEGDRRAGIGQVGDESKARRNRLGRVDEMFADEGFVIAESIGEHDRFAILPQNIGIGAGRRVNGLDEESELQRGLHGGSPRRSASPEGPTNESPRRFTDRGLSKSRSKR